MNTKYVLVEQASGNKYLNYLDGSTAIYETREEAETVLKLIQRITTMQWEVEEL